MRISDWSSDVCSSDLIDDLLLRRSIEAVKARSGGDADYVVGAAYRVRYTLFGDTRWREVVVPAGLTTDLASVPRLVHARSEECRVGEACVRPCRSRWSPYP